MLKPLLWLIAASQLVLAAFTLFLPLTFCALMGLGVPSPDGGYLLGMLGARFLAYGIGMAVLGRQDAPSPFWLGNMMLVQVIDLACGLAYVAAGTVPLSVAAFPMVNATLFIAGLAAFGPWRRQLA